MGRVRFHKGHQVIFGQTPSEEALACLIQWTREGKRKIVHPESVAEGRIDLPFPIMQKKKPSIPY
jgi:branched-chain amino acid transport system substrate-binding protein